MKYVAYEPATGKVRYFYDSPVAITEAPEGLALLEISDEFFGHVVDTHRVVDGRLEAE